MNHLIAPSPEPREANGALPWLTLVLLSALPIAVTVLLKPQVMALWDSLLTFWAARLGLSLSSSALGVNTAPVLTSGADGTALPSSLTLLWTWAGLAVVWGSSHFFSDRFHPLQVVLRAMCLIQATACLYFMFAPSSFPYTVTRHTHALLDMGYGLMLASGPLLALGWGILQPALLNRVLAPLAVLTYLAWMLPHKVLVHAWVLEKGSALFMPLLFLCFGSLLDLWIFIALYGWLASQLPRVGQAPGLRS